MTSSEKKFQAWYGRHAKRFGLGADPDDPSQFYDYRSAYAAGIEPGEDGHWDSKFKRAGHPNMFPTSGWENALMNGVARDSKTGELANPVSVAANDSVRRHVLAQQAMDMARGVKRPPR